MITSESKLKTEEVASVHYDQMERYFELLAKTGFEEHEKLQFCFAGIRIVEERLFNPPIYLAELPLGDPCPDTLI